MRMYFGVNEIIERRDLLSRLVGVNYNQLDLHFIGNDAFYVNRRRLPLQYVFSVFGEAC